MPGGVQGPFFNDDFGDVYGVIYALQADGFNYAELKVFADDVRQQLLRVTDVNKVDLFGVQETVNAMKAAGYAVAGWVWCAAKFESTGRSRWLWLAGVYGSLGLGSGGFGLVFTVPWVLWCLWMAWKHSRWMLVWVAMAVGYSCWVVATMPAMLAMQPSA